MNQLTAIVLSVLFVVSLAGCGADMNGPTTTVTGTEEISEERGPNNGRLLRDGDFAVELAIFETGVPPEFRAWAPIGASR